MPWVLETMTPVFIGSGSDPATPLDFLVESNGTTLRFVPFEELVQELVQALDDPSPLLQWMERQTRPTLRDMLDQPWADPCRTAVSRFPPIPLFTTQSPSGISEVARFLRDGMQRPYIPGTTLKGALRTALLYDFLINSSNQNPNFLPNLLNQMSQEEGQARRRNRPFRAGEWFERQVFRGRERDTTGATWDILRAISVADSAPIRPQRFFVGEVRLVGSQRTLSVFAEALIPGCPIQVQPVRTPRDQTQALSMMQSRRHAWDEGWTDLLNGGWVVVARACHRWSQDLLEAEIDHWQWLARQPSGQSVASDVLSRLQELQKHNQEDRPLLRIGMHQGALSLTIGLAIRKHGGPNSEEYRRWARWVVRGNRPVSGQSPKTRKAIYFRGRWWPLGWVRISKVASEG
jgi:CRISPR type III-A-associated RAMP protein Csm5